MHRRTLSALALTSLAALALSGCSMPGGPRTSASPSADPRAVSSTFERDADGYVAPGSGVTVGTTVPTLFVDSSGTWKADLTIDSIVEGKKEDLSVVQSSSTDLSAFLPYYTTITVKITGGDASAAGKSVGDMFSYETHSGAQAPRLISINGVFPACTGSDTFPAQPDASASQADKDKARTITFCQVSLAPASDAVDQVNWHPDDTPYNTEDGKPVFFRPAQG